MNELLLIDMLSEVNAELLQDDYMESDIKPGVFSFLKKLFSFKKLFSLKELLSFEKISEQPFEAFEEEVTEKMDTLEGVSSYNDENYQTMTEQQGEDSEETKGLGFSIHIFQKKINVFVKIISGITATLVVVIGIILFFITKNKGSFLLKRNKAALN